MAHKEKHHSINSVIEPILVMKGDRSKIEFSHIHHVFWPETGDQNLNGNSSSILGFADLVLINTDLKKIYFDDESYHHGHGHAYEQYGIDPKAGCIVVVRPDQRISFYLSFANNC